MKRWGIWLLLGLLLVGVVAAYLEPTQVVMGKALGESFFESRPTRYWARSLQADPGTQAKARSRLEQGGASATTVLTGILRDYSAPSDAELRCAAIEILGKLGPDAATAGPDLVNSLNDRDPHVQAVSIAAIPKVEISSKVAVPLLVDLLRTENSVVAARALSQYKAEAAPALPELVALLQDTSQDVEARWNAARTIGKIGPEANSAVPVLIEMTRDKEPTIREHSAEAIGDIGSVVGQEAIKALVATLSDPVPRVRRDAVRSLGYIGPKARETLPAIQKLSEDPEEIVRQAAKNAIQAIAPEQTPPKKETPP